MNFRTKKGLSQKTQVVIEVTPIVDIVFQLLIFFLLTATFVKNPNFDINLPEASSKLTSNVKEDIRIVLLKDGTLKYDNKPVKSSQIKEILEERFKTDPTAIVLIQADRETKHGKVVEVMDMAKMVG
ncbi:MAG: biopolymer transporter ExbD, partial [Pseudomonadota bacterium]